MSHKSIVTKQIVLGMALIAVLAAVLWQLLPGSEKVDRVSYTLSWTALFALPLLAGIHSTLFARFNSDEYIKGYTAASQPGFHTAYLSNTLEQTVVNVLAAISLGMVAPLFFIKWLPIQACIFVIGRLLYFFTYKRNPMHRFVGFVMGYYVALLAMISTLYWVVVGV